jgi:hypothetical protein
MFRVLVGALGALAFALPAAAQVTPFPGDFRTQEITTDDGATIHLRAGGQGPAVVRFCRKKPKTVFLCAVSA